MGNNSDEDSALSIEFNDSEKEVDEGDIEKYKILHKENSYEDHESEDSETCDDKQEDADENEGNEYIMNRFPTHKLLKNMSEYKWEVGTLYNTKEDFKEAISTYAVHVGKGLKFIKNDKERVRVRCKTNCDWEAYCAKLKGQDTWQLRKINDKHTCSREVNNKLLKSKWLSRSIQKNVKENPKYRLKDIIERSKRKWNVNVSRSVAITAKRDALYHVHGSFQEQFRRLYDYCHELKRSDPNSTVLLKVNRPPDYDPELDTQMPSRNMLPVFERLYVCFEACKKSFFTCRPIIGLDGCFLKGPYKCQLLAAIGRDPNEQMLPIAIAVVEAETKDSWTWFLSNLIEDLGGTNRCRSYTFISDQQKVNFIIFCSSTLKTYIV